MPVPFRLASLAALLVLVGCRAPRLQVPWQWPAWPHAERATVAAGDTVCTIAGRMGVAPDALARANGLDSRDTPLTAGTVLDVPDDEPAQYVVRPGDTLSRIGRWTGLPVPRLAEENDLLDPDRLAVGQWLELPAGARTACAPVSRRVVARASGSPAQAAGDPGGQVVIAPVAAAPPPETGADGEAETWRAAPAGSNADPKAAFARSVAAQARRLYEQADFEGAADVARAAPPWDGHAPGDPVREAAAVASLYEGLAMAGMGRDDDALDAFVHAREADPSLRLPEELASPPVRTLFEQAGAAAVADSGT